MKPYYQNNKVTLYCADCRDVLPGIEADVVITDPPYGVGVEYNIYKDTRQNLKKLINDVWPLLLQTPLVAATTGVMNMFLYPKPLWSLCWFSAAGIGMGPWGFCTWQPILVWGKDPYLAAGKGSMPDGFSYMSSVEKNDHPVPKPAEVMRWIIKRTTLKPCTILDPFAGSGVTLTEAQALGHKAIGIELDEKYCELIANRLERGPVGAPIDGMRHSKRCRYPILPCICEKLKRA